MASIQKIEGKNAVSYKLIAFYGYDSQGKKLRKTKTWTAPCGKNGKQPPEDKMEKQAHIEAANFEAEVNQAGANLDTKMRFAEYTKTWYDTLPSGTSPKTLEQYTYLLVRINAELGELRVRDINRKHIQKFIKTLKTSAKGNPRFIALQAFTDTLKARKLSKSALAGMAGVSPQVIGAAWHGRRITIESGNKIAAVLELPVNKLFAVHKSNECLSDKTVRHHYVLLSTILNSARLDGLVTTNPCELLTKQETPKASKREATYLTDMQAKEIVSLLFGESDIRIRTSILLALCSGCRRGELLGLSWQDIDATQGEIHINKATQYQPGRGVVVTTPKNETSERVIDMPHFIFAVLDDYRAWWEELRTNNGDKWQDKHGFLFVQENGLPLFPDTFNDWVERFINKNNLERFTPHALRHTFISLQIADGVDIKALQKRTGHALATTLLDTYAHAFRSQEKAAANALNDRLAPPQAYQGKPMLKMLQA